MKDLYIYQEPFDDEKSSVLKIKNPKRNYPKIEISYFKKREFKKLKKCEESSEQNVKILGFTKFKAFNGSEEEYENCLDDFVFVKGERYYVTESKSFFRHIKGYVEVIPILDSYESKFEQEADTRYFLAITRFSLIPLLPLIPLLLLIFSLHGCPKNDKPPKYIPISETTTLPETTGENKLPIDDNADKWNGSMPSSPSSSASQDEIEFVGYDELTVSKDNQIIELINPYNNSVYFKYSVYADDKLIYTTNLIPSGKSIKFNIYSALKEQGFSSNDGKISLAFFIETYDAESQQACTPCTVKTKISII